MQNKTAQRRGLLNKLHEMANVPARSAKEFFKPELKRIMGILENTDDVVRAELSGSKVGKGLPQDSASAKDLLKEAKSFLNRREYFAAIANLGRFHKKMSVVMDILKGFDLNVDSLHHQFLFGKMPNKQREQLKELKNRLGQIEYTAVVKEAGVMDFFHNIGTQRGRALAMWEKRYPKVVAKIKDTTISQLDAAQSTLDDILITLKAMASARVSMNIDEYINLSKDIVRAASKYDSGFKGYYSSVVKPYLDKQEQLEHFEKVRAADPSWYLVDDNGNPIPPTEPTPSAPPTDPSGAPSGNLGSGNFEPMKAAPSASNTFEVPSLPVPSEKSPNTHIPTGASENPLETPAPAAVRVPSLPTKSEPYIAPRLPSYPNKAEPSTRLPAPPKVPTDLSVIPNKRDTMTNPPITQPSLQAVSPKSEEPEYKSDKISEEMWGKSANFIASLEKLSDEHPRILASYISKYANKIKNDQPEVAIQLFKIAKNLKG